MICQGWRVFSPHNSFLFLIILLTTSGCAKSNIIKWASLPVPIYTDSSIVGSSQAQSDLLDAMRFWEERAGRTLFDYRGVWTEATKPYTGSAAAPGAIIGNVIFFENPWPAAHNIIGQTVVTSYDHEIEHAMIMINPYATFCSGDCEDAPFANSARKNLAHELGHFLGLQHHGDVQNVMYPVLQPGGSLSGVTIDATVLRELTTTED